MCVFLSVPDKVEDETVGCLHFADEFSSRYGPIHPEFFPGSLEDAIKDACMKPAREVRHFVMATSSNGTYWINTVVSVDCSV